MVSTLNRLILVLFCLACMQGQVLAERLDDSLSPRRQVDLDLEWQAHLRSIEGIGADYRS